MSEISGLLSTLEDPFVLFPLQSVSKQLETLLGEADDQIAGRAGWWGVSPKYRTVEDEHDLEVIRLLIGSAFVLGQVAITQTVSIVTRLRVLTREPSWLPSGRANILKLEAVIHPKTNLSEIFLFDAVANYFKHHYEWPSDWVRAATPQQQRTIDVVSNLGLAPEGEDNLYTALQNLGIKANNVSLIGISIQNWRERLAENLRKQIYNHGFA